MTGPGARETTTPDMAGKVIRCSTTNLARGAVAFLVTILLTPYIVSRIGLVGLGVWSLANIINLQVGALDLGISASIMKLVAEHRVRGEFQRLSGLVTTGLGLLCVESLVVLLLVYLGKEALVRAFFHTESFQSQEIIRVLLAMAGVFSINLFTASFGAIINGQLRMDVVNSIQVVALSLVGILTWLLLRAGLGLEGLVIATVGGAVFALAVTSLVAHRMLPQISLRLHLISLENVRTLMRFGGTIQFSGLQGMIFFQYDKILLGRFLGLDFTGLYEIGARLAAQLRAIATVMAIPLLPAASELDARGERGSLQRAYRYSMKYVMLGGMGPAVFAIAMAPAIMRIWMGEGYELSAMALRVLMIAYSVNVLTAPMLFMCLGVGWLRITIVYTATAAVTHLALSAVLLHLYGFLGVLFGTLASTIIAVTYFAMAFHRRIGVPLSWWISRPVILPLVASLPLGVLSSFLHWKGIEVGALGLAVIGFGFATWYLAFLLLCRYFDTEDRKMLGRLLAMVPHSEYLARTWLVKVIALPETPGSHGEGDGSKGS